MCVKKPKDNIGHVVGKKSQRSTSSSFSATNDAAADAAAAATTAAVFFPAEHECEEAKGVDESLKTPKSVVCKRQLPYAPSMHVLCCAVPFRAEVLLSLY